MLNNFITWFKTRAKEEPAMMVEDFRKLLLALPLLIGYTADEVVIGALVTVFSIIISHVAERKLVRDKVTPIATDTTEWNAETKGY